jgi:hypothetical protein
VRIAIEETNTTGLMPNYSSLLMSQSQIQLSQIVVEKEKQEIQESSSLSKSCLQQ